MECKIVTNPLNQLPEGSERIIRSEENKKKVNGTFSATQEET
jgi:hypothetical protein